MKRAHKALTMIVAGIALSAAPTLASVGMAADLDGVGGPQIFRTNMPCIANPSGQVTAGWDAPPTAIEGLEIQFTSSGSHSETLTYPAGKTSQPYKVITHHPDGNTPTVVEARFIYEGEPVSGASTVTVTGCRNGGVQTENNPIPANLMYEEAVGARRVQEHAEVVVRTKTFELPYRLVFLVDGEKRGETYRGTTAGGVSKASNSDDGTTTLKIDRFGPARRNISVAVALPHVPEAEWPVLGSWDLPAPSPDAPTEAQRLNDRELSVRVPAATIGSDHRLAYYINDSYFLGITHRGMRYATSSRGDVIRVEGDTADVRFAWRSSRPEQTLSVYWVNGSSTEPITEKVLLGTWDVSK